MNGTSLSTFMNFSIILFECLFSGFQRFIVVTTWFGFNLFVKLERIACSVEKVSSFESKMFGYNQPSKVTVVFRYISVVRSSGIHYRPTYHGQISSGTLGDYHSLWSTISWYLVSKFIDCCVSLTCSGQFC